jgi:hypothetical protein
MSSDTPLKRETDSYIKALGKFRTMGGYSNTSQARPVIGTGLLALLGCPYLGGAGIRTRTHKPSVDVEVEDREDASICIVRLLTASQGMPVTETISLLVGLSRRQALAYALSTERSSYALACAVLQFIEDDRAKTRFNKYAAPFVRDILNDWIHLEAPRSQLPVASYVVRHLFGEAWSMFAENDTGLLCNLVARQRPPFLPGLCPPQDRVLSAPLPQLEMAP